MSYMKKCDRCGKDISEGVQCDDNEFHFTKKRNTRFGYDKCIHLCNECLKEFDEFMLKEVVNK